MMALFYRIEELDNLGKARALNDSETRELDRLIYLDYLRRRRVPGRIAKKKAELAELIGQLPPAEQLRELRGEVRLSWERLRALEEALEPGAHLTRILNELNRKVAA